MTCPAGAPSWPCSRSSRWCSTRGRSTDSPEKAIRFAGLGLAWAVSTAGLFVSNTTKSVEFQLRQIGATWRARSS